MVPAQSDNVFKYAGGVAYVAASGIGVGTIATVTAGVVTTLVAIGSLGVALRAASANARRAHREELNRAYRRGRRDKALEAGLPIDPSDREDINA